MLCKLKESIKRSKVINNDDKTVILQEIPVMKSVLEEVVQDLRGKTSGKDSGYASSPGETSVPLNAGDPGYESEEDSGYNSRSSTPIKLPNSLLTESYERSQSEEAQEVRRECGEDLKIITPGIRIDPGHDDQKRTATPREAINLGADYIVIGRPEFHGLSWKLLFGGKANATQQNTSQQEKSSGNERQDPAQAQSKCTTTPKTLDEVNLDQPIPTVPKTPGGDNSVNQPTPLPLDNISNKPFEAPTLEQPKPNTTGNNVTQQVVNNDSNREATAEVKQASSSTTDGLTELPGVNSIQELSTPNNEPVKIDTPDQPTLSAVPGKSQEPVVNPPKTEEKGKPNDAASNEEVQSEVSNKDVDSKVGLGSEVSDNEGFEDAIKQSKSLEVQEDEVANDMQNHGHSQNSNGMAGPLAKPDQESSDEPNQSSFDNKSVKDDDKEANNPQPEISANGSAPTDSSSFDIVSSQETTPDELQEPDEDKELTRQL
ncbi:unnamed protein product [Parnassius apollo]|uniref:(apollo) hypothetical protein n=1 Tax=Parnassius apollo TaxID=110799 RepID=A0A8S3Y920_PARAO|nr:unnamed protein product [Parnassius apollo]